MGLFIIGEGITCTCLAGAAHWGLWGHVPQGGGKEGGDSFISTVTAGGADRVNNSPLRAGVWRIVGLKAQQMSAHSSESLIIIA